MFYREAEAHMRIDVYASSLVMWEMMWRTHLDPRDVVPPYILPFERQIPGHPSACEMQVRSGGIILLKWQVLSLVLNITNMHPNSICVLAAGCRVSDCRHPIAWQYILDPQAPVTPSPPDTYPWQALVAVEKQRPELRPAWGSHRVFSKLETTLTESWDNDENARLSSKTIQARIIPLLSNESDSEVSVWGAARGVWLSGSPVVSHLLCYQFHRRQGTSLSRRTTWPFLYLSDQN